MGYRKFNGYSNALEDLKYSVFVLEKMLSDIDVIIEDYSLDEEDTAFLYDKKEYLNEIYKKYKNKVYITAEKINDELLSPVNVEHSFEIGSYPKDASDTYKIAKKEFEEVFDIEEEIFNRIVAPIWEKEITGCDNGGYRFSQGDHFEYVVHPAYGYLKLPSTPKYRDIMYNNNEYISCSVLSDKCMDMNNNKVGVILKVDEDSLVASSRVDCVTSSTQYDSVHCVKSNSIGEKIIAGNSYVKSPDDVVTKLLTPKAIIKYSMDESIKENGEILNNDRKFIINEVIIDKEKAEIDGVFLLSNGCDFLLNEFIAAHEMKLAYGKPLIIVNKSFYRKKEGLEPFTEREMEEFHKMIEYYKDEKNYSFMDERPDWYLPILTLYVDQVIYPNNYEPEVKEALMDMVGNMKTYLNLLIDEQLHKRYYERSFK